MLIKDPYRFDYTIKETIGMWNASQAALSWSGKLIDDSIKNYKTSDTVFLLGSGPSINDMTDDDWAVIKRHDSIGFNFSMIHEHIPSMYMLQFTDRIIEILKGRKYTIPILIRGSVFAKQQYDLQIIDSIKNNEIFYVNEYAIHSQCEIDPFKLYEFMEVMGFLSHGVIGRLVPKWRSTIGLLISLSFQMGYKKIVLCGCDMRNSSHFWEIPKYDRFNLPTRAFGPQFADKNYCKNTVDTYIVSLNEFFKDACEIYIMNKKTILHPRLKLYKGEVN